MALSSTEFKQLTYGFGRDLHDVKQHLYFALNGELSESEREEAIAAGEKKLKDYAKLLESCQRNLNAAIVKQLTPQQAIDTIAKETQAVFKSAGYPKA